MLRGRFYFFIPGVLCVLAIVVLPRATRAASLDATYASQYTSVDLGSIPNLPERYGGMTFLAGDPNTLLIGGMATDSAAGIYSVSVARDANGHITGFSGPAAYYAAAGKPMAGGIDGGLAYGPDNILFYTSFPDNRLGEIQSGGSSKDIVLTSSGYDSSVGGLSFLPSWLSGSNTTFKLTSFSSGEWYTGTLSLIANGFYGVSLAASPVVLGAGIGPEGFAYVQAGTALFTGNSVLIADYSNNQVLSYLVDANGDPILASQQTFLTGLTGPEGVLVDPLTGDFLFSTSSGSDNELLAVQHYDSSNSGNPSTAPLPSAGSIGLLLMGSLFLARRRRSISPAFSAMLSSPLHGQ